jgi:hypothetical protein
LRGTVPSSRRDVPLRRRVDPLGRGTVPFQGGNTALRVVQIEIPCVDVAEDGLPFGERIEHRERAFVKRGT